MPSIAPLQQIILPSPRPSSVGQSNITSRYGCLKPCLHGSDAHEFQNVGVPDKGRYCWVKGALAFDTLKQAYIDPASRCFVGEQPPVHATPSQVINSIEIVGANWAATPKLDLNPGLVTIIGARGSGKTALADMIALACDATAETLSSDSFLIRASELLEGVSARLEWNEGGTVTRAVRGGDSWDVSDYPRARYLSQKFVEELCAADGMTDALMREIERVIFEAHPMSDRDGALDFNELLELRASRFREMRIREDESLAELSERIGTELEKMKLVDLTQKQVVEKEKLLAGYMKDRSKLVAKGSEGRVARLTALTAAAEKVRGYIRHFTLREQTLLSLKDEVGNVRAHVAPETLRKMAERHKSSALTQDQWKPFLLDYSGDVDGTITAAVAEAKKKAEDWKGQVPTAQEDQNIPYIADDAELERQPLSLLQVEIARLQKIVNVDKDTKLKFDALTKKISEETAALGRLKEKLEDVKGASTRVQGLLSERDATYQRVFDAIESEEKVLNELYSPLMTRLQTAGETLKKLSLSVHREVDLGKWAAEGEKLLDLRIQGVFKGQGSLKQVAETDLRSPWESGDASAVRTAMTEFRKKHSQAFVDQSPVPRSEASEFRAWGKQFAQWLYSTQHISLHYGIEYDGVDIRKLSPGTRGIVLLLLYLALDDSDDRPLIIDQPEENLDPKSIFEELVGLFIAAKSKRQVIMVTHNANLVVNTDTDQVIIASAGPHPTGELPPITYVSGGLESGHIRRAVCDILEGGESAFQERARRLRVQLGR